MPFSWYSTPLMTAADEKQDTEHICENYANDIPHSKLRWTYRKMNSKFFFFCWYSFRRKGRESARLLISPNFRTHKIRKKGLGKKKREKKEKPLYAALKTRNYPPSPLSRIQPSSSWRKKKNTPFGCMEYCIRIRTCNHLGKYFVSPPFPQSFFLRDQSEWRW